MTDCLHLKLSKEFDFKRATRELVQEPTDSLFPGAIKAKKYVMFSDAEQALRNAFEAGRLSGLEQAAQIAETDEDEYRKNASLCDQVGSGFAANNDLHGAAACKRVAKAIRELIQE